MRTKPIISVVLETRRANKDNLFLVTLKANFQIFRKEKKKWVDRYYSLGIYASKADFAGACSNPRTFKQRELKREISEAEGKANKILDSHTVVTPEIFERFFTMKGNISSVGSVFNLIMHELHMAGRIGNANMYKTTRNSIARFVDPALKKMITRKTKEDTIEVNISFYEINNDWLHRYADWLRSDNVGPTTIAIYLTHLKAVFNRAIKMQIVKADLYPFGVFKIKKTQARKIALTEADKNKMLSVTSKTSRLAIDFWLLSYYCFGLNMLDIASIRVKDIRNDVITIQRHKKKHTDMKGKLLVIPIRQEVRDIIQRWGNKTLNPDDYVFPILYPGLKPFQIKNRVADFVGKVNDGLRKVKEMIGLDFKLTTYTARHTFANIALQKGASKEFIQEALGHSSIMTTENYLSGFDIEAKKAISSKL